MSTTTDNSAFELAKLFSVEGKVALITGGGTGIGLMATQALAVNGAKVYIVGRREEKLEGVVEKYGQGIKGSIEYIQADVTSKPTIKQLVADFSARENKLDILFLNAGIAVTSLKTEEKGAEALSKALFDEEKSNFEDWTDTYRTNVAANFFLSSAFLPLLEAGTKSARGHSATILLTTSISGFIKHTQHHPSYNASKAAAVHLTKMLATEIAESEIPIRVNAIAPGVFPSEMTAGPSDGDQKNNIPKEKYEAKTTAKRPGKDTDMANAVLFAVTNDYLNGQNIVVDGGYLVVNGTL